MRGRYLLGRRGAVLVRPDGYVAWRCERAADPGRALQAAVAMALGQPAHARHDGLQVA